MLNESSNRICASLELLRYKLEKRVALGRDYIDIEELNDVFVVAGLPVIIPEDIKNPEIKVIGEEA